jgi:hypothetical protein
MPQRSIETMLITHTLSKAPYGFYLKVSYQTLESNIKISRVLPFRKVRYVVCSHISCQVSPAAGVGRLRLR